MCGCDHGFTCSLCRRFSRWQEDYFDAQSDPASLTTADARPSEYEVRDA
jgi:hypothetical protein